jgi:hypothetical protein
MALTPEEDRIISILVENSPTYNPWSDPMHAIDSVLQWNTAQSRGVVKDLVKRGTLTDTPDGGGNGVRRPRRSKTRHKQGNMGDA